MSGVTMVTGATKAAGADAAMVGAPAVETATAQADASVVYYTCKYAPLELLAGLGAHTRLLDADVSSFEVAERLSHANLCGFGKAALTLGLNPEVRYLVLTNCCDVMRRVYDVLAAEKDFDLLILLDLPHKTGVPDRARWRAELRRLVDAYRATPAGATASFDAGRALASFEAAVPRPDAHVTLRGAHAGAALVEACGASCGLPVVNDTCTGPRILWSPDPALARAPRTGSCRACEPEGAADACAADARTADAGSSAGERELDAFLDWYAGALLDQTPCMRMDETAGRGALGGTAASRGIIYHTMKFCDYYSFEYAGIHAGSLAPARDASEPVLKIETDGTSQSAGQLRTRLAAFGETLGSIGRAPQRTGDTMARTGSYILGIDSGSTTTDAVVFNRSGEMVSSVIVRTGAKATAGAARAIEEALAKAGITEGDLLLKVATGYGRDAIPGMDAAITEITCHARGAHYLAPQTRTVIDIGGQDSKVIHLDEQGGVVNFVMNDKCAAGTGRFLEAMARTLEMSLEDLSHAGLDWHSEVKISNMCTVFAESEVITLIADDTPAADIVHGLNMSVATKTAALGKRVGAEPSYLMTGGVANNRGVVEALAHVLGAPVHTHEESQLCGAIGAALLGIESLGE